MEKKGGGREVRQEAAADADATAASSICQLSDTICTLQTAPGGEMSN